MSIQSSHHPDPAVVVHESVRGRERVEFIHHAMDRASERGITTAEVILCLREPSETDLPADPPRLRFRRLLPGGAAIDVVFEEHPDFIRVISTYVKRPRSSGRF